jgi:cytochrome c peroxidase
VWFYKKLFWDGRSHSLEDQAFAPINSESEMHGDMRELPRNLKKVRGYSALFEKAFGDSHIEPDRIAAALAAFQRTIRSGESRFDKFINGDKNALSNSELKGLHLFRTKASCMNCHNGPMFSDNQFHNNGFAGNDIGLYHVTHDNQDKGKMKTPSLRDVANTGPWMHDGNEKDLLAIIEKYNRNDHPEGHDPLLKKLHLSKMERLDLLAFLKAISAPPREFNKPRLPE